MATTQKRRRGASSTREEKSPSLTAASGRPNEAGQAPQAERAGGRRKIEGTAVSLLSVRHLKKAYDGHVAVDDLSFDVHAGEVFGLLGPNGAGKTTTMSIISGLLKPDAGQVLFDGRPVHAEDMWYRRQLGVAPQNLAIYPDLTAAENLAFFGRLYGLRGSSLRRRMDYALELAGLTDRAHDLTGTFSGGMKRRLNFAVAVLHAPRLLILDEPTVGVDPQSRAHILSCVRRLAEEGTTVIYASHYMEEVQSICQRIAIMDHGRLLRCGTLHELLGDVTPCISIHMSQPPDEVVEELRRLPNVTVGLNGQLVSGSETCVYIRWKTPPTNGELAEVTEQTLGLLRRHGVKVRSIRSAEPDLEELFLRLTGHGLRD